MKNYTLLLLAGATFLVSCGTYNKASNSQSAYQNGIYYNYNNDESRNAVYNNIQDADNLQAKTYREIRSSNAAANESKVQTSKTTASGNKTIYVGDTNQVTIQYNPNVTYSIMDDDESYEARLRKFDSPTYTVNISFGGFWEDPWYSPWWGGYYDRWYRPSWITWGAGWYNPYYGYYYSWWGPRWGVGYSWYNGWYVGAYGWYDPWYYGYGGWYDPWYYGGRWNNPWYDHPHWGWNNAYYRGRDIYYGKRESSPSYNNMGSDYGSRYGNRSSIGSVTRRPQMNTVRDHNGFNNNGNGNRNIYTGNGRNDGQYDRSNTTQRGTTYTRGGNTTYTGSDKTYTGGNNTIGNQSTYRRAANPVPTQSTYNNQGQRVTNNPVYQNNRNNNRSTSYSRSSSSNNNQSYNRSSSSYSSGSNSSGSNSSGGSRSGSSGGSSYRR